MCCLTHFIRPLFLPSLPFFYIKLAFFLAYKFAKNCNDSKPVVHFLWPWEFVRSIYALKLRVWENQRYLFYCNNIFIWTVPLPSSSLIQACEVISRINISQVLAKTVTVSWTIILISLSAFITLLIGASGSLWFFEVCSSHSSIWLAQNRTWRQSRAIQMHEMMPSDLKESKAPTCPN